MEVIYLIAVIVGFVAVVITILITSHKERLEIAKINKQKEIAFAKLLRLTDPLAVLSVEPQEEKAEEKEEVNELVDITDMPNLPIIDKE